MDEDRRHTWQDPPTKDDRLSTYTRRVLIALVLVALALFLWQIRNAILLAFGGILVAVLLRGMARLLREHTPLPMKGALAAVVVLLLALLAGLIAFVGPRLSDQFVQLGQSLPQTIQNAEQYLSQSSWGQYVIQQLEQAQQTSGSPPIFSRLRGVASVLFGILSNLVLVLFVGLFFALNPGLYRDGILRMIPKPRRARAGEVLDTTGRALWLWLLGRLVAMIFVGIFTAVGLMLLGMPLALALGFIAGLFDFVPFVGPIAAAVPALLLALSVSPTTALYTALLYLAIQQIEGNVITPLVQQKAVDLPPVLTLMAVVALGLVFGTAGIILATPLAVLALVLTKMLYVEDVLGDEIEVLHGRGDA